MCDSSPSPSPSPSPTPAEPVTVKVGNITDLTGAVSGMIKKSTIAIEDYLRWMEKNNPIPGVHVEFIFYDQKYDPSRDIPGFQWAKSQGVTLIQCPLPATVEAIMALAEDAKIPIMGSSTSTAMVSPDPKWNFTFYPTYGTKIKALLKWLTDEWQADGKYASVGAPKLGYIGWSYSLGLEMKTAVDEFMAANPGKIDLVDSILVSPATVSFTAEVDRLKTSDYVLAGMAGTSMASFFGQFRNAGHDGIFIGEEAIYNFIGLMVKKIGAVALDGTLVTNVLGWWTDPTPLMDLCDELMQEYRSVEEIAMFRNEEGGTYYLSVLHTYIWTEILRDAVAMVGAENVDGQAWYNAAISFMRDDEGLVEGYGEWTYSETKRLPHEYVKISRYDAATGDLVQVADWVALG